jgi:glutamate-1-semialdehyde 2,1-aminomutase
MSERRPRTARESALLESARRLLPAGVRTTTGSPDDALVVAEAHGAHLTDASGNEYVDYLLGSGPMLLGHAHPAVVEAVTRQVARGSSYLMVSEPAIALAEEIVRAVPCAEQVAFHSSGSESTFFALRVARAYRRRDAILKFEGGFHGMSDYALMSNQWTPRPAAYPEAVPNSAGIPRALAREVLIAPFNDAATATDLIERHHDALAAVIIEPLQRTIPPAPGFLQALRDVTRRYDVPLVFDEVVTGFRLAYGGAQEYYGVTPDLCALGKSISGGHPLSVLCGSTKLMRHVDPIRAATGDHAQQTGTYSGNPISCAVALAILGELKKPDSYTRLFATGRRLMDGLRAALTEARIPAQVTGEPPCFEVWFTDRPITDFRSTLGADRARHARFTAGLLARGIVKAHEKFFVSLAHDERDVARTLEAVRAALGTLADREKA